MSIDRPLLPNNDPPKPGRKISFVVQRNKGKGVMLVEGAWLYEGAELDFAKNIHQLGVDLLREGKLWLDGDQLKTGPRPAPVPPPPLSKLDAALHAFSASRNTEKLELLMRSIGSIVEQVCEHSKSISDRGLDEVENDTVEALLGSALLLCQSHMKSVLRHIEAIKPLVRRRKAVRDTLLAESNGTSDLLDLPSPRMLASSSLTQVTWALADYYKQRDQWPASWNAAKRDTKRTISILSAAGITQHTPHKLQAGVRAIGVSQYANLALLGVICDHWGNVLSAEMRTAIGRCV